jgi:hypothetical protein
MTVQKERYNFLLWHEFQGAKFQQIRIAVRIVERFSRQICGGQILCCKRYFSWLKSVIDVVLNFPEEK